MASTSLHILPGEAEFLSALSKRCELNSNSNKLPRNYFDAGRDKETEICISSFNREVGWSPGVLNRPVNIKYMISKALINYMKNMCVPINMFKKMKEYKEKSPSCT